MDMAYDFDTLISRKGTGAEKWNMMYAKKPAVGEEIVPLSVADMEFSIAPEIREALVEWAQTQIPGYTSAPDGYLQSVCDFMKRRHEIDVGPEMVLQTPGVVFALSRCIRAFSEEGEGVIIMTPVYYPFYRAIQNTNRVVVRNPLHYENGRYSIDFDLLEKQAAQEKNTVLLLCSPHNPVGRVWTEEEILRIADICERHHLSVISDEIHFDLIFPGHQHFSFAKVQGELAQRTIVCTAPSKTFNLAGMNISNLLVRNEQVRKKLIRICRGDAIPMISPFGYAACQAAYEKGEAWLEALLAYLDENRRLVASYVEETMPQIKVVPLEGTYLQWLDCTALGLSNDELETLMIQNDLFLDEGYLFGEEGSGFERINLACPRAVLQAALERFKTAVEML